MSLLNLYRERFDDIIKLLREDLVEMVDEKGKCNLEELEICLDYNLENLQSLFDEGIEARKSRKAK